MGYAKVRAGVADEYGCEAGVRFDEEGGGVCNGFGVRYMILGAGKGYTDVGMS